MATSNTTPTPAKKAATKALAKKAASTKTAPVRAATPPLDKAAKPKRAPRITSSTDPQHQAWQVAKKDLTAVMAELLYDSRRVVPDHAKSAKEAYAKVGAALKVLTEFTESIRIKK